MKRSFPLLFLIIIPFFGFSQPVFGIKGKVIDNSTGQPVPGALIAVTGTAFQQKTGTDGTFGFTHIPAGKYTLHLEAAAYLPLSLSVVVDSNLDMDLIPLEKDHIREQTANSIVLTENDLEDDSSMEVVSGLLQSSKDAFSRSAAFEFSQTFFKVRGLDAGSGVVLLNGIKMNKLFNGRPQWSNWGGLNDVTRNQEFTSCFSPSDDNFGGLLGTTYISTRASGYRPGFRLSASSSNRGYSGRFMATYSSGLQNNTSAYTVSASRRWAAEGFTAGTLYDAWSVFGAYEYRPHRDHSFNITALYTPNRRGKSAPNTREVYDLKGIRYNPYWGWQDGKIRNSRIRRIQEPIFILSHYWNISDKSELNFNIAYQAGKTGNSRIDFGGTTAMTASGGSVYYSAGASNPDPVYYQKLPGYLLSFDEDIDYEEVHRRRTAFMEDGQIDWNKLYAANLTQAAQGKNAAYILYEDRNDDKQFTVNAIFNTTLSEHISLDASLNRQKTRSENFAGVLDLLGGTGYLDVDSFADTPATAPNDLQHPDRNAGEGDRFKYNYNLFAGVTDGFVQAKFRYNTIDFYLTSTVGVTAYQREGLYQNGAFPEHSLGKGPKLNFTTMGGKAGGTYKINARHFIDFNTAYLQEAPVWKNVFSNARQNHDVVRNITTRKTRALDASYIIRSPGISSRLTGYYRNTSDDTEVSFYFVDGLNGDTSSFVQEVLTGIEKRNLGLEFGIEASVTPAITLKAVAAVGEFIYHNDPGLYLTSDDFEEEFPMLTSRLKNYKLPGGPQRAFSAGFEYRDPDFWWVGATVNYFSNAYIGINPLRRTANFYTDVYGLPFPEYDQAVAKTLLRQEKLDDYYLLNLIGGKSWSIKRKHYIGVFASINNLLNQRYRTGGFEQARNGNYRELLDESQNEIPVFGNRYWYGSGSSYFINVYLNFQI